MDDLACFYRARYFLACQLARAGRTNEALQICFELHSKHNLSIWRRACVHVLFATLIQSADYTCARKVAKEALKLFMQIRMEAGCLTDEEGCPLPRSMAEDGRGLTDEEEQETMMLEGQAFRVILEADRQAKAAEQKRLEGLKLMQNREVEKEQLEAGELQPSSTMGRKILPK